MANVNTLCSLFPLDTFICFIFFQTKAIFIPFLLTHCSQDLFKSVPFGRQPAQIIYLNRIGGLDMQVYSALLLFSFLNRILFIFFPIMTKVPIILYLGFGGRIYQVCCLSFFSPSIPPPFSFFPLDIDRLYFMVILFFTQWSCQGTFPIGLIVRHVALKLFSKLGEV